MWTYNYSDELYHHGIKGQRWGIRRFQNKDGSLTNAGKKRRRINYDAEAKQMSDDELRSKVNRLNLEKRYMNLSSSRSKSSKILDAINKTSSAGNNVGKIAKDSYTLSDKDSPDVKLTNQGLNLVSKSASTAKKINDAVVNKKNADKSRKYLSTMTDEELKNVVNRMDLEQQYSSLKKETVSKGKITAMNVLEIVGDVLAVGASATAMAVSIRNLKKQKYN